jgi:hypothetical protein
MPAGWVTVPAQQLDHSAGQLTQKVIDVEAADAGVRHRGDGALSLFRTRLAHSGVWTG